MISIEKKIAETRAEKEAVSRDIGRVEGMIDYESRRLEKIKKAGAENESEDR